MRGFRRKGHVNAELVTALRLSVHPCAYSATIQFNVSQRSPIYLGPGLHRFLPWRPDAMQ